MKLELKPAIFYYKIVSQVAILFGIVFYIGWLLFWGLDKWNDMGVYSITIVLVGFGAASLYTYTMLEKEKGAIEE
jgi:hypothetical protein